MEGPAEKDVSDETTKEAPVVEPPTSPGRSSRRATAERMARIGEAQKKKGRKAFLTGLFAGQLLVLGLSWGGDGLQSLLQGALRLKTPMPVRSLVFCSMTAGILLTGAFIMMVLSIAGLGWFFSKKKAGFGTSLWRGIKRMARAAASLGITLVVIGGTAWLLITPEEWGTTSAYLREKGEAGYGAVRTWVEDVIHPNGEASPDQGTP